MMTKKHSMRAKEDPTLESFMILEDKDFISRRDGMKVSITDLLGEHDFTPTLIEAYCKIKKKSDFLEMIFTFRNMHMIFYNDYYFARAFR